MNYFLISLGGSLFILVFIDFFYTTISCNGSGRLTQWLNSAIRWVLAPTMSGALKKWAGLIHLFFTLFNWVFLLIISGFLIYSSFPEMVVQAGNKLPANSIDRLYFSSYVFSTLGNGGFTPGNCYSQLFTALFSVSGFGMLTTGITYLLSVTNAALMKKNLAGFIAGMGSTPYRLFQYFREGEDVLTSKADQIVNLLLQHTNNHLSYPVVHFFSTNKKDKSVLIHLSSLYEVLSLILKQPKSQPEAREAKRVLKHIEAFLQIAHMPKTEKFSEHEHKRERRSWLNKLNMEEELDDLENPSMDNRWTALLKGDGWKWSDVYKH